MKRFMRVLAAVVSGTALVATGLVFTAPVAQAGSCYYTNNPQWNTTQWSRMAQHAADHTKVLALSEDLHVEEARIADLEEEWFAANE